MVESYTLSRRAFIQAALAAAAISGTVACNGNESPWRFLTIDEARALAAISDQIIPSDQDPGASWAGVVNYIDRQLCGPFRNLQGTYRHGLTTVDQFSHATYGKVFADLRPGQQLDLLRSMETGSASGALWSDISPAAFFSLLIDHTMQGYYGDPRHGGNRDGVSWKMLGLPYPPIRGRQRSGAAEEQK